MSKEKKFLRKCISCGEYRQKKDLIKITSVKQDDLIYVQPDGEHFGRSCYICKDKNCIDLAFKKSKISKIMKKNVPNSIKEKIITVLDS